MKLLHLTDTHLGAELQVWGAPKGWRRSEDHVAALRAALAPAFEDRVDLVIHSGDVFDRSEPPAEAQAAFAQLMSAAARHVPVVVLAGNHDRVGLKPHLSAPPPNLILADVPMAVSVAGVRLGLVPFRREPTQWAAEAAKVSGEGIDLLVAHQAFDGARVPGFTFRVGRTKDVVGAEHLPAGVRDILCGHIHARQETRLGDARVVQPGSTERTAFAEAEQTKGFALWTLEGETTWTFEDLPTRPMQVIVEEADLDAVVPEALVLLPKQAPAAWGERVLAQGGWLTSRKPRGLRLPRPQGSLFGG